MGMRATEDWTDERQGANILFSTTPTGTTQLYERLRITDEGRVGIGLTNPTSMLQIDGGIQIANDTDAPSEDKVGTIRYRADSNNSYVEMCMQVGPNIYQWTLLFKNSW